MLSATTADFLAVYPTLLSGANAVALTGELTEYYARRNKNSLAPAATRTPPD